MESYSYSYEPAQTQNAKPVENMNMLDLFPLPPASPAQTTTYAPPMVISLGEEWTESPVSPFSPSSDTDSYFAFSPTSSNASSPTSSPQFSTSSLPPPLWQAEHAQLLSLRDNVLSSERAARYQEIKLEREVERIKQDLERVKRDRAAATGRRNSTPDVSYRRRPQSLVRRASDGDVSSSTTTTTSSSSSSADQRSRLNRHAYSTGTPTSFWLSDEDEEEEDEEDGQEIVVDQEQEDVLNSHLDYARSQRAQQRQKRKRDCEKIRELGVLLTLGSEVRQWEERLAWANAFASSSSSSQSSQSSYCDMDLDDEEEDDYSSSLKRGKRLSKSEPATPPSHATFQTAQFGPRITPPLPPLSASPLWKVSAEMILRRRSSSSAKLRSRQQQKQQQPPLPLSQAPNLASSASSSLSATQPSAELISSTGVNPSEGTRPSLTPLSIPQPCLISTSNAVSGPIKVIPSRPSALKCSFTLEDLINDPDFDMEEDGSDIESETSESDSEEDDDEEDDGMMMDRGRRRWRMEVDC